MNRRHRTWLHAAASVAIAATLLTGCTPVAHTTVGALELVQEPDAGIEPIRELITNAHSSIRVVMYQLADRQIVADLIAARRRGVDTRVVLDVAYHGRSVNAAAYRDLNAGDVAVAWAPDAQLVHQKTISVDAAAAAIGTGNLVAKHYTSSRDDWIIDRRQDDIAAIDAQFDADYPGSDHAPGPAAVPPLLWSPGARPTFLEQIAAARRSIDIATEVLTDRPIVTAISRAARRGVACRIILPDDPDSQEAVRTLRADGCAVRAVPAAATLYPHQKMMLIDAEDSTHARVIVGSHNLTTASLRYNRELSLLLDRTTAADLIDAIARTFGADFTAAP